MRVHQCSPVLLALIAVALLGGCGNKGPLVMPDGKPAGDQKSTSAQAAPPAVPPDRAAAHSPAMAAFGPTGTAASPAASG